MATKSIFLPTGTTISVDEIQTNIFKSSTVFNSLRKLPMGSNFIYYPLNSISAVQPNIGFIASTIKSLKLTKKHIPLTANITNETIEDITTDGTKALQQTLTSQLKIDAEFSVVDNLYRYSLDTALPPMLNSIGAIGTVISKFDKQVSSSVGDFVVILSFTSYLDLVASYTTGTEALLASKNIRIVNAIGIPEDTMLILHTSGCGYGLEINSIELENRMFSNAMVGKVHYAAEVIPGYGYKTKIHQANLHNII